MGRPLKPIHFSRPGRYPLKNSSIFSFPRLLPRVDMSESVADVFDISAYLIVGAIAAASFALDVAVSVGLNFRRSGQILGFYISLTRAREFAAGALLAPCSAARHSAQAG